LSQASLYLALLTQEPIVFDTNFGGIDVSFEYSLSLRERARVRESNEVHSLFLPLILTFSRREKEPMVARA